MCLTHVARCTKICIAFVGPWWIKGEGDLNYYFSHSLRVEVNSYTMYRHQSLSKHICLLWIFLNCAENFAGLRPVRTVVQGTQLARVVNKVSARKLYRYIDVDTTNFIERWVRMTIYRGTVAFRRHLPPNQNLLSPLAQSDKDTLEQAWWATCRRLTTA